MAMKKVSLAQLNGVLQQTSTHSERRLPSEDLKNLGLAIAQMQKRYPSQDLSDSAEVFLEDFERLAIRHSTQAVIHALKELRISPEQTFFPTPSDVAAEIERARCRRASSKSRVDAQTAIAQYDRYFWEWVDARMDNPDTADMTEQEFLDSLPEPGRKARTTHNGGEEQR